jgi:acyl-CoA reductase-like NAD-dependent aldehyde dehydrogenase
MMMQLRDTLYLNGAWVAPTGTATIDVLNPTTEEVLGQIPAGTAADSDRAITAAAAAFPAWAATPIAERAAYCQRISELLLARQDDLATLIAQEVGTPLRIARQVQVGLPATTFGSMPELATNLTQEERIGNSLVVRAPVGVVGCITPWNYPLHQTAAKVAPALTAGCTVVLKPSEVAPLNAFVLAEIIHEAGLPAGVFNLVTGFGPEVGEAIVTHPLVDMISFTGSVQVGQRIAALAAQSVKRVALELGGKSPLIVLDDADLRRAVVDGVNKCFLNSGQTCSALTRLLVPRAALAEAETIAVEAVAKLTVGDPLAPSTKLGPVVSAAQRQRVVGYITTGIEEGAKLLVGGVEPPEGLAHGYFVQPTIFSEVRPEMTIAQQEIFGPVLVIMPYEDEDDAVRIANDTRYGLAGGVWSGDLARAERVARRLRTGQVDLNGGPFNPRAPFGGFKQSGYGRELGPFGLEEFCQIQSLQLPVG